MEGKLRNINKKWAWIAENLRFNFRVFTEYKAAFVLQSVGMILNNAAFLVVWYIFFHIFGSVNGWGFKEMLGLDGFVGFGYGVAFSLTYGATKISKMATFGLLDRFLTLPQNTLTMVSLSDVQMSAIGDLVLGALLIGAYVVTVGPSFTRIALALLFAGMVSLVVLGFTIVVQSIVFWIPNSQELSDALFEFMLGPSLMPNSAFTGAMRFIFTFIIPAIVIGGLPVNIILSPSIKGLIVMTAISLAWVYLAQWVFNRGLRRYESGNLVGTR